MTSNVVPLRRVVVATDFTPGAAVALQRLFTLPLAAEASIELLHVLPSRLPRKASAAVRADAIKHLGAAVSAARRVAARMHSTATIGSRLEAGPIPDSIIEHARSLHADLVVIGRHGRRTVRDWFIGSTARRVAHRSSVPVLLVNDDPTRHYRRPIAAIDPEHYPDQLLDTMTRVLGDRPVVVRLVHAYHVLFEGQLRRSMSQQGIRRERAVVRSRAMSSLRALIGNRRTRQIVWKPVVRRGDPRTTVLEEAKRRRSDLIVIGTRGRSAIARALIGGVAELVIDAATCDVLVVPPTR